MKKIIFLAVAAIAAMLMVSSCESTEMTTHYIKFEEGNANFTSNLYLQSKVMNLIQYNADHLDNSFFGTEKDAMDLHPLSLKCLCWKARPRHSASYPTAQSPAWTVSTTAMKWPAGP